MDPGGGEGLIVTTVFLETRVLRDSRVTGETVNTGSVVT